MKSIVKKVLDTVRPYKGAPIHAVKGDYNSRFINAVICTEGVPVKAEKSNAVTVTFETAEASRTFPGTVNDDGSVEVPIVAWALENEGDVWCYISVSTEESSLTAMKLLIEVHDRGNVGGEITEDDPEYDDILVILARLSDHDVRISQTEKSVEKALQLTSRNDKRITNMEARINPSLLLVDDSVSYAKPVPENALPYAEIVKVGGMSYRVNTGTEEAPEYVLQSAPVTEIVSIGVNLLPMIPESSAKSFKFNPQSDGSYKISGTRISDSNVSVQTTFIKPLPAGTYTVSLNNPSVAGDGTFRGSVRVWFKDQTGEYTAPAMANAKNRKITFTSAYPIVSAAIRVGEEVQSLDNFVIRPQLERGTTATPFSLYNRNTFPIPEAVQALSGYGEGNPDDPNEYNAIIWRNDGRCVYSHKGNIDGAWVPLATPEIIDISDLLPDDNYIEVEENGTIFMENQFGHDVPSTIEFQLKEVQA
jgi:hypothetical protein